ncbi:FixH family protein [Pedobacter nutrimenti]|uniref:FixH family protein n=1 Tax=Pedobacter nutrimenti TaxID=1241337 RepID=UPI00292EBEA5|nr:FixH family protein [Pedobacter nutrimenti]
MKWNWGTKLVIGLAVFMTFIIVLGIKMIRSKSDALVDNDYYEKGIHYDQDYLKKENVKKEHAEPVVERTTDTLVISFKQAAAGEVQLIRTADKKLDQKLELKTDSRNQFRIPVGQKASGLWKLKMEWKNDGKSYLYEKEVML